MSLRVLLLADSHLGFDLPLRPRVHRRRRGHDFFANYLRGLGPALEGRVDLVVHGGDVFHRPRVPKCLVFQAFEPLATIADRGVPVFVVPGNHERGRIPHVRFAAHPGVHVFDRPRTFRLEVAGLSVSLAGFPYARKVRDAFPGILADTGWRAGEADVSLLCFHHCFEGATVGPVGFTFRRNADVVQARDVPPGFAAVLSGHIHRHQVLTRELSGRRLACPVLYPGSVERTAFAERAEEKGYMLLDFDAAEAGGRLVTHRFVKLPARPMIEREVECEGLTVTDLAGVVDGAVDRAPRDAILRFRLSGSPPEGAQHVLSAPRLRARAPAEMNVEVLHRPRGRRGQLPS